MSYKAEIYFESKIRWKRNWKLRCYYKSVTNQFQNASEIWDKVYLSVQVFETYYILIDFLKKYLLLPVYISFDDMKVVIWKSGIAVFDLKWKISSDLREIWKN